MTMKYIPQNQRAKLWEHFQTMMKATEASYRSAGALIQNPMDFNKADLELGRERFQQIREAQDKAFGDFGDAVFDSFVEGSVFADMDTDDVIAHGGTVTNED